MRCACVVAELNWSSEPCGMRHLRLGRGERGGGGIQRNSEVVGLRGGQRRVAPLFIAVGDAHIGSLMRLRMCFS